MPVLTLRDKAKAVPTSEVLRGMERVSVSLKDKWQNIPEGFV